MKQSIKQWELMAQNGGTVDEGLEKYYKLESKNFLERLKKGPPPKYRWAAWRTVLHTKEVLVKGLYDTLTKPEMKIKSNWIKDIRGDVNRTFPEILNANQRGLNDLVVGKLENILIAISLQCPKIGYCQGMNYVIGFMLLISNLEEEEVFWAFIALERDKLVQDKLQICGVNGMYMEGFPKMNYIMECFHAIFAHLMPDLKKRFDRLRLIDLLWAHKWIFAFFLFSFPFSYCIRFWDYILAHGISGSLRISLAIVKVNERKFEGKDFNECYKILDSFIDGSNLPNVEEILKVADQFKINQRFLRNLKSVNYQSESLVNIKNPSSNIMDDVGTEAKMNSMNAAVSQASKAILG
jgi:CRISPR/Cas system CSM-associated protein Csm2 small subunit